MAADKFKNLKLGVFVITGTALLIIALYMIGNAQSIFSSTVKISARFRNVNGLSQGNNVRFGGIDVGAVDRVVIASDTDVLVEMLIEEKVKRFIHKDYIASVGTDGLMGNRLINIVPNGGKEGPIEEGDELHALNPLETEEMMRAFNATGKNMKTITDNLSAITSKLRESNSMWTVLGDTTLAQNFQSAIIDLKITGNNTATITGDIKKITDKMKDKNSFVSILTDTAVGGQLKHIVVKLDNVSDTAARITGNLSEAADKINKGSGTAALLINDTAFAATLKESVDNLKSSSKKLDENLEGLKHSFLLKRYFKNKEEEGKKQKPKTLNK